MLARALILGACVTASARAQSSSSDGLSLDKLQIISLGVGTGRILPSQVVPTALYSVSADYGTIAPNWHLEVNASYWTSRYRDAVVQGFVDQLNANLVGAGTAHVAPSRVSLYDVTFGADARYTVPYSGELKPFVGLGVAAHVINAEGELIRGTFVERSLDNVATGFYVTAGISLHLVPHLGVEGGFRGDLLSGFRSSQARVGATYFFGSIHGTRSADGPQ